MDKCKYCDNKKLCKFGRSDAGQQRYRCNSCIRTFTEIDSRVKHDVNMRNMALSAYLSGLSIRGTQKLLELYFNTKLSFSVVNNWIKNYHGTIEKDIIERGNLPKSKPLQIIEKKDLINYKSNEEYGIIILNNEIKLINLK